MREAREKFSAFVNNPAREAREIFLGPQKPCARSARKFLGFLAAIRAETVKKRYKNRLVLAANFVNNVTFFFSSAKNFEIL